MNDLGNTNKMVDTPRTEAEVNRQKCWSDDLVTIDANFACQLERELNAANQRIKRLEEQLIHSKNKHAVLVSDVVLYEDRGERIKQLEEALSCVVVSCAYLHHPKKYRHKLYEACPVENLIKKARKAKP